MTTDWIVRTVIDLANVAVPDCHLPSNFVVVISIVQSFPIVPSFVIQIVIATVPTHSRTTLASFPSTSSILSLLSLVLVLSLSSSVSIV